MRPHVQTDEARRKDLMAFTRALGRAETAPKRDPELVQAIRKVIRLYASGDVSPSSSRSGRTAARQDHQVGSSR
jgi:hypothetical protein